MHVLLFFLIVSSILLLYQPVFLCVYIFNSTKATLQLVLQCSYAHILITMQHCNLNPTPIYIIFQGVAVAASIQMYALIISHGSRPK